MKITNKFIEKYLSDTHIILVSVKEDEEVKGRIVEYGYNDNRLQQGLDMHAALESIYQRLITVRKEQMKMSHQVKEQFEKVYGKMCGLVDLLKSNFYDQPGLIKELGLKGSRSRSIPSFIEEAVNFYTNMKTKPHILEAVATFGLSEERLQAELDEITELQRLQKEHKNLIGENQRLTRERDMKLAEFRRYMNQLKTALFMVFGGENPQILERVGVFVRNRPRARSEQTEEENTEVPADTSE